MVYSESDETVVEFYGDNIYLRVSPEIIHNVNKSIPLLTQFLSEIKEWQNIFSNDHNITNYQSEDKKDDKFLSMASTNKIVSSKNRGVLGLTLSHHRNSEISKKSKFLVNNKSKAEFKKWRSRSKKHHNFLLKPVYKKKKLNNKLKSNYYSQTIDLSLNDQQDLVNKKNLHFAEESDDITDNSTETESSDSILSAKSTKRNIYSIDSILTDSTGKSLFEIYKSTIRFKIMVKNISLNIICPEEKKKSQNSFQNHLQLQVCDLDLQGELGCIGKSSIFTTLAQLPNLSVSPMRCSLSAEFAIILSNPLYSIELLGLLPLGLSISYRHRELPSYIHTQNNINNFSTHAATRHGILNFTNNFSRHIHESKVDIDDISVDSDSKTGIEVLTNIRAGCAVISVDLDSIERVANIIKQIQMALNICF